MLKRSKHLPIFYQLSLFCCFHTPNGKSWHSASKRNNRELCTSLWQMSNDKILYHVLGGHSKWCLVLCCRTSRSFILMMNEQIGVWTLLLLYRLLNYKVVHGCKSHIYCSLQLNVSYRLHRTRDDVMQLLLSSKICSKWFQSCDIPNNRVKLIDLYGITQNQMQNDMCSEVTIEAFKVDTC